MIKQLPTLGEALSETQIKLLYAIATDCRRTIISMLKQAQSGHPGGSLGSIDYLTTLYAYIISQTQEVVVVSNGHISPAVYSILAELGYEDKQAVIDGFRKIHKKFEGHVTRHVNGVWYGTGPLGAGISAAAGFAIAEKLQNKQTKVYATIGDGESEEGQVYEMMNFAHKYKLDNFVVFMDYNQVQLTDGLEKIMPLDPKKIFTAGGWHVIEVDGHDYQDIWQALGEAQTVKTQPVLLLGHTIMGKGVSYMEEAGKKHEADWHGKAPSPELADKALAELTVTDEQQAMIADFLKQYTTKKPKQSSFPELLTDVNIDTGDPHEYAADELTDCRTAYGKALLDLAKKNENIVALTADLAGSVKTSYVKEAIPERHIECGIAEQHMVSCAGGMSLHGMIPFASTFGAFMTSRAKDQARVNDINQTNVKMVATHCGLSVGEDGPTHQAIDDMNSMFGLFNTMVMEPADPNQCDRMIRYIASHYGNFYVRMGRHKIPVLTCEDGSLFYDKDYEYIYGKCDLLRPGTDITIAATGATANEALAAWNMLQDQDISAEIVIMTSPKQFDETIFHSIEKTKKVLTIEDHNTISGYHSQLARYIADNNLDIEQYAGLGVPAYQLSGTAKELYAAVGIDADGIVKKVQEMLA